MLCDKAPRLAPMVSVEVAAGVLLEVVIVNVDVAAPELMTIGLGLKLPLAPAGNPLTLGVTLPVKPFTGVTVRVYVVVPPATIVREAGLTATWKSFTLRIAVVVRDCPPLLPEMLSVASVAGVVLVVETVIVEEVTRPPIVVGLNVAFAPAGNPVTPSVTVPVNPLRRFTVMV